MNTKYFKNITILTFCFAFASAFATPTTHYLEDHPIADITQFRAKPAFTDNLPLLMEIASKETDHTFFGYHGMSQKSRLFQDILRAVFEESLKMDLPPNFYFLRIPGDDAWNWEQGKTSFMARFDQPELSPECGLLLLKNLLALIEKSQGISLKSEQFSSEEQTLLIDYYRDYIAYKVKSDWVHQAKKYSLPQDYTYDHPKQAKSMRDVIALVDSKVAKHYPEADRQKLRRWFESEYQDYAVFLLSDSAKENMSCARCLDQLFHPFDDRTRPQQSMLVALNASLFANYTVSGCFTPKIFVNNQSAVGGDECLEKLLKEFFDAIGLDPTLVSRMWSEGQQILEEAEVTRGCLLQFFDESAHHDQKSFAVVDHNVFLCFRYGIPVKELMPSKFIQGAYTLKKEARDLEMRLVMNNRTTLNPYGALRMMRYDPLPAAEAAKIIAKMKAALKAGSRDEAKLHQYKGKLEKIWKS